MCIYRHSCIQHDTMHHFYGITNGNKWSVAMCTIIKQSCSLSHYSVRHKIAVHAHSKSLQTKRNKCQRSDNNNIENHTSIRAAQRRMNLSLLGSIVSLSLILISLGSFFVPLHTWFYHVAGAKVSSFRFFSLKHFMYQMISSVVCSLQSRPHNQQKMRKNTW